LLYITTLYHQQLYKIIYNFWVWVLCYNRRSVGQSLLEQSTYLGPTTRYVFISLWQLQFCFCGAPSLTRVGRFDVEQWRYLTELYNSSILYKTNLIEIYIISASFTIHLYFSLEFLLVIWLDTESNLFLFALEHWYTYTFYKTSISHSLTTHISYHHDDIEKLKMFWIFCHVLVWLWENQTGTAKLLCLVNCVITDKEKSTLLKQI
jgi:hypothetical protein